MNFPSRILLFVIAGGVAGLLTVLLTDGVRLIPILDGASLKNISDAQARNNMLAIMAFCGFLGTLLGTADTLAKGAQSQAEWLRVIGFGILIGMAAGFVGANFGMAIFGPLYTYPARNPIAFVGNVIARAFGWALIGALAGTVDGWRKQSVRIGRNGLIGGLIGGFLGGGVFEIVPYLMPGVSAGAASRTLGFVITGAMIGLFIALVQEWLKEAWVKIVLGKNEGKEVLIEKVESRIGRAELSEIPLFGNPQIARRHAVLVALPGGGYAIHDTNESPLGVFVNDTKITGEQPLRSGDKIQIADRVLVFFVKNVKEHTVVANRDVKRPSAGSVAVQPGVSPYAVNTPSAINNPGPNAAKSATPRLVATAGPHSGQSFALVAGSVAVIGREASNPIPIPSDTKSSRSHAKIFSDANNNNGFAIEDLGSTNGTFVNGQRITKTALSPGDTILIGTTAFRFEG
jgi:pSer/pThr/pTyr-binding forkhead associated (FHA) protein